jgi:Holliday junction resolvase RusA-like endonuclease
MREMKYFVPIKPLAWKRPGVNHATHSIFDQQKADKIAIGLHVSKQHGNQPFFKLVAIHINFLFKESAKHKSLESYPWHNQVPDIDNLTKLLFDSLVGICFIDDCVIAKSSCEKRWSTKNGIEITITELMSDNSG